MLARLTAELLPLPATAGRDGTDVGLRRISGVRGSRRSPRLRGHVGGIGQVLAQAWWDVGARWRRGTGQGFCELLLRHLSEQSAFETAIAIHVDVPAQPLVGRDIGVLLTGLDPELLALSGR
ncbi:hypothetical protein A7G45_08960 [Mycolicibacterium llatzerense]|nr:hypothetical protein [Mycolicibacterium llatzerense]